MHGETYSQAPRPEYGGELDQNHPPEGQGASGQPPEGPPSGDYPEAAAEAAARATREREQQAEADRLQAETERVHRETVDRLSHETDQAQQAAGELTASGTYQAMQEILNTDSPSSQSDQADKQGGDEEDPTAREQREQRERDDRARRDADISRAEAVAREMTEKLERAASAAGMAEQAVDQERSQLEPGEAESLSSKLQLSHTDIARVRVDLERLNGRIEQLRAQQQASR